MHVPVVFIPALSLRNSSATMFSVKDALQNFGDAICGPYPVQHCKNGIVKVTTKVVMFTTNPSYYHVVNSCVVKITTTDDVITEYFLENW